MNYIDRAKARIKLFDHMHKDESCGCFDEEKSCIATIALRDFVKTETTGAAEGKDNRSNHDIGCDLEALANVMEYRGYFEHAMKLREIASVIK